MVALRSRLAARSVTLLPCSGIVLDGCSSLSFKPRNFKHVAALALAVMTLSPDDGIRGQLAPRIFIIVAEK